MESKFTQYRKFAEECERLARAGQNEHHRSILKEMADAWRNLAAQTEKPA